MEKNKNRRSGVNQQVINFIKEYNLNIQTLAAGMGVDNSHFGKDLAKGSIPGTKLELALKYLKKMYRDLKKIAG